MDGADLVHWTLPLLVNGAYGPPLLFGRSLLMMNHEHVHPTNLSLSISSQELRTLDDPMTPLLHVFCELPVCQCYVVCLKVMPGHA
jgi:hypothetical protein